MDNALCVAFDYIDSALVAHIRLVCDNARVRLAQTLVDLTRSTGRKGRDGVELQLTNEELADAANVTVFVRTQKVLPVRTKIKLRITHGGMNLPFAAR